MGCLKKIIRLIVFIILLTAFFYFNGPAFLKQKYDEYTSPPREILIKEETNFGNLAFVPDEYKLQRSLGIGKFKKITATYNLTGQKIAIFDTGSTKSIDQSDFYSKKIDDKLYELLDKLKQCPIGFSEIEVTQRGTVLAKGKIIPYVNFKAKLKGIPFIAAEGTLAAYNTRNSEEDIVSKIEKTVNSERESVTTKIVLSSRFSKYSYDVTNDFIKSLSFTGLN